MDRDQGAAACRWLAPLLVAALLREDGLAHHPACLHLGQKNIPRERRRAGNRGDRLLAFLDLIHEAALAGLKEHDRLVLAKNQMARRLRDRRASSKLPRPVRAGALGSASLHRHDQAAL
jgi:hypothetical protein